MALFNASPVAGNSGSNWASKFNNAWSTAGTAMTYNTPLITTPSTPAVGFDSVAGDGVDPSGYEQAEWEFVHQQMLNAEARAFNSAEAQKTRDWQERLSNTAYQRAVQDLEAAGLNKWLAVTGGNGASSSTPSGASASSSSGDASSPDPKIYKALIQFAQAIATSAIKLIDFF